MSTADDIKRLAYALASAEMWDGYAEQQAAEVALHNAIDALQSERDSLDERIGVLLKEYAGTLAERDVLLETQRKFGALMHKTMEERDALLEALTSILAIVNEEWHVRSDSNRLYEVGSYARRALSASEGKAA
jgi:seryl-tRNA synthetase